MKTVHMFHVKWRFIVLFLVMAIVTVYVGWRETSHDGLSSYRPKVPDIRKTDRDRQKLELKDDIWQESNKADIRDSQRLNAYLVEEHHEVLPYWFRAVDKGVIPRSGNTLIHIDGHSDMSIPVYFQGYPFFKYPKDSQEISFLMQKNDVFIMAAAMTGLFSRVVWIWPRWDSKSHETEYLSTYMEMGWTVVKDPSIKDRPSKEFCMCYRNITLNERECVYAPDDPKADTEVIKIDPSTCHVIRSFVYEEIREDIAVTLLERGDLIQGNETVMLDIDEDYFGCTHASQPLLNVNVSMRTIKDINRTLKKLVCPVAVAEEHKSDKLLTSALDAFKHRASCGNDSRAIPEDSARCPSDETLSELGDNLVNAFSERTLRVTCSKKTSRNKKLIEELIYQFRQLESNQIQTLQKVGFCAVSNPKPSDIQEPAEFQICQGANFPGDSVVLIHQPDTADIERRADKLRAMLTMLKPLPNLITLCRSVRDGYTPREYFELIEETVMKIVLNAFPGTSMHYDSDLLGGKTGWPNRRII